MNAHKTDVLGLIKVHRQLSHWTNPIKYPSVGSQQVVTIKQPHCATRSRRTSPLAIIQRKLPSKKPPCCIRTCPQFSNSRQDQNWHIRLSSYKGLRPQYRMQVPAKSFHIFPCKKDGLKMKAWTVATSSQLPATCSTETNSQKLFQMDYLLTNQSISHYIWHYWKLSQLGFF
jgi:hypothetical protein